VHRKNILTYIQQDATLHSLFYLETALRVLGGTFTHHQERKQLYLQHLVLTCICLTARLFRITLVTAQVRDVMPGPLTVTDTCIMYRLKNFDASRNVSLDMRYVSTCVGARVVGG
jgi:hypothetical protein